MQQAHHAELRKLQNDNEITKKQLEVIVNEKNELLRSASSKEALTRELENKIIEYE